MHKIKALPHFCTIIIASALSLLLSWNNIAANNKIVLSSLQKASEIGNTRAQRLSDYVVENTGPDDEVYFLTYSGASTVLYRAKRLAASRYSYLPINLESFSENRKTEMVREVIADLMKNPPELLIVDTKWYVSLLDYLDNLDNRQRWEEFVAGNYNEVHSIDEFKMMKRNVP